MFSMGRRVFRHHTQERYLLVPPGKDEWVVKESIQGRGAQIASSCAPSMCPADPRARSSVLLDRTAWVYMDCINMDGDQETDEWRQGDITVKCSVHNC